MSLHLYLEDGETRQYDSKDSNSYGSVNRPTYHTNKCTTFRFLEILWKISSPLFLILTLFGNKQRISANVKFV